MAGVPHEREKSNTTAIRLVHRVDPPRKPVVEPIHVTGMPAFIGRTARNDVVLPSGNVSRRHAKLITTGDSVMIHDLDSHNGVFINGTKVRSAPVQSGDLLYIADVCLEVHIEEQAPFEIDPLTEPTGVEEILGDEQRNLTALTRACECISGKSDRHLHALVDIVRELTDAHVAGIVVATADGQIACPVLSRRGPADPEVPVIPALVHEAIAVAQVVSCLDIATHAKQAETAARAQGAGAYVVVPIPDDEPPTRVVYVARSVSSTWLTEREVETIAAIARLIAVRDRSSGPPAEPVADDGALARASSELQAALDRIRALEDTGHTQAQEHEHAKREIAQLQEDLERATAQLTIARTELSEQGDALKTASSSAADAIRSAMRSLIPTPVAEHVEAVANGSPATTDVSVRSVTALFLTLRGFDAWAATAQASEVKKRLDAFCSAVAVRARANGGRVEQVLGHAHLVTFSADVAAVRAAARCAVEVASVVEGRDDIALTAALHVSALTSGYFGDGDAAAYADVGEAVLVTRGVAGSLGHEPGVYATEAVKKLVADDPALALALVGQVALVGAPSVVIYRVQANDGRTV